ISAWYAMVSLQFLHHDLALRSADDVRRIDYLNEDPIESSPRRRAREDTTRGGMLQGLTAGLRLSRSALLGARVNRYGDEGRICARVAALDLWDFQCGAVTHSAEKAVDGQDGTDFRRRYISRRGTLRRRRRTQETRAA